MWLVFFVGCSNGWVEEAACGLDPYDWSDDALGHVLQGDGDGAFSYDPLDEPRAEISGAYYPATGEFTWSVAYVDRSYLTGTEVEGYGTVYHNGNLDLLYTATSTDVLDNEGAAEVRVIREGCATEWWSWPEDDPDDVFYRSGEYTSETTLRWTAEADGGSYEGTYAADQSSTSDYEADDGSWEVGTTTSPDGTSVSAFAGASGCIIADTTCEGTQTEAIDGSVRYESVLWSDGEDYAEAEGDFAYDGDGELVIAYEVGVTCTFDFDEGGCDTYACDNGDEGSCS
jgi:hypothetical protein